MVNQIRSNHFNLFVHRLILAGTSLKISQQISWTWSVSSAPRGTHFDKPGIIYLESDARVLSLTIKIILMIKTRTSCLVDLKSDSSKTKKFDFGKNFVAILNFRRSQTVHFWFGTFQHNLNIKYGSMIQDDKEEVVVNHILWRTPLFPSNEIASFPTRQIINGRIIWLWDYGFRNWGEYWYRCYELEWALSEAMTLKV